MDVRNSILIILVYCVLAVTLTLLVFLGYRAYVRPSVESDIAASLAPSPRPPNSRSAVDGLAPTRPRVSRRQSFEEAVRKIEQLKRALDRKEALLREKSQLLDRRTKEYEALRAEADQYFSLTLEMLGQDVADGAVVTQAQPPDRTATQRLEQPLGGSAGDTLESALEEASWQLDQAYAQMDDQQLSSLLEDQLSIQAKAASVLVAAGAPAVPPLADALSDERAEVRRWAATVLGQIGAHAIDATDALATATEDEDESVRQAAREALARIENAF